MLVAGFGGKTVWVPKYLPVLTDNVIIMKIISPTELLLDLIWLLDSNALWGRFHRSALKSNPHRVCFGIGLAKVLLSLSYG